MKILEKVKTSNIIKTLCGYLGLSQAAFAKPLDLSPTHIARFEQGISPRQVNQPLTKFVRVFMLIQGILVLLSLLNFLSHLSWLGAQLPGAIDARVTASRLWRKIDEWGGECADPN